MLKVEELQLGHRYLFLGQHVDTDDLFEGVLEEESAGGKFSKIRFEDRTHSWRETKELFALEELPGRSPYAQPA